MPSAPVRADAGSSASQRLLPLRSRQTTALRMAWSLITAPVRVTGGGGAAGGATAEGTSVLAAGAGAAVASGASDDDPPPPQAARVSTMPALSAWVRDLS